MSYFADKLGKSYRYTPMSDRPVSWQQWAGKPCKVVSYHGGTEHDSYFTVQFSTGDILRVFENELTDEISAAISKDELAAANMLLIETVKVYLEELITVCDKLGDKQPYVNGFKTCISGTLQFMAKLERSRDNGWPIVED